MQRMLLSMSLIRHEHAWFSLFGFALAAFKLLGDTGHLKGALGNMPVVRVRYGLGCLHDELRGMIRQADNRFEDTRPGPMRNAKWKQRVEWEELMRCSNLNVSLASRISAN